MLIMGLTMPAKQYAQTALHESIAVRPGQTIDLHFDYPELITVTTWDKNEISIQGQVSINGGENDDAFKLVKETGGTAIRIAGLLQQQHVLARRYAREAAGGQICRQRRKVSTTGVEVPRNDR